MSEFIPLAQIPDVADELVSKMKALDIHSIEDFVARHTAMMENTAPLAQSLCLSSDQLEEMVEKAINSSLSISRRPYPLHRKDATTAAGNGSPGFFILRLPRLVLNLPAGLPPEGVLRHGGSTTVSGLTARYRISAPGTRGDHSAGCGLRGYAPPPPAKHRRPRHMAQEQRRLHRRDEG